MGRNAGRYFGLGVSDFMPKGIPLWPCGYFTGYTIICIKAASGGWNRIQYNFTSISIDSLQSKIQQVL